MPHVAYCYRSGLIKVGRRCPDGALPLAYGSEYQLRKAVFTRARHGYERGVYLVPGIPEAADEDAAIEAVKQFSGRLAKHNGHLVPALVLVAA